MVISEIALHSIIKVIAVEFLFDVSQCFLRVSHDHHVFTFPKCVLFVSSCIAGYLS